MKQVKVTWKAFGDKPQIGRFVSSIQFKLPVSDKTDLAICEEIFKQTNLYQGTWWSLLIEPLLSETRTHTALSVGDEIEINGQGYVCADIGWVKVEDAEIEYLSSEYGDGAVFTVREKVNS